MEITPGEELTGGATVVAYRDDVHDELAGFALAVSASEYIVFRTVWATDHDAYFSLNVERYSHSGPDAFDAAVSNYKDRM